MTCKLESYSFMFLSIFQAESFATLQFVGFATRRLAKMRICFEKCKFLFQGNPMSIFFYVAKLQKLFCSVKPWCFLLFFVQELSETWIADVCLWMPWMYAGDLMAQECSTVGFSMVPPVFCSCSWSMDHCFNMVQHLSTSGQMHD